jgi:hypothetical protein
LKRPRKGVGWGREELMGKDKATVMDLAGRVAIKEKGNRWAFPFSFLTLAT